MTIQNDAPKGRCAVIINVGTANAAYCGQPKMERIDENGQKAWICPKHGTPSAPASNKQVGDVPIETSDFKLVVNNFGFIESVPKDDPRPEATTEQQIAQRVGLTNVLKQSPRIVGARMVSDTRYENKEIVISIKLLNLLNEMDMVGAILTPEQLVRVYDGISALETPKNLKDAKVLIKLQDEIDKILGRV